MSRTFDYHFTVVVQVEVDDNGNVVNVLNPYTDDCVPPNTDTMVYDDEDDWVHHSPADMNSDDVWVGNGWSAATDKLNSLLSPLPRCLLCSRVIEEHMHDMGGDPCCAPCYHEPLIHDGGGACDVCDFVWPEFVCDECERTSDGERHVNGAGRQICSECLLDEHCARP